MKLEPTTQEPEYIDFITLGLNDIKQEILEPECVVTKTPESNKNFRCTEENCRRDFFGQKSLIVHKNRCHSQGKKFWCWKCKKMFSSKKEMVKCQKLHLPETSSCSLSVVSCPDCSTTFPSKPSMISHRNKQHGRNIFYCKPCDISYKTKVELVRCQKLHYANKIANLYVNCAECDKKLKKTSLHLHLKFFHEKKRDQQCQVSKN